MGKGSFRGRSRPGGEHTHGNNRVGRRRLSPPRSLSQRGNGGFPTYSRRPSPRGDMPCPRADTAAHVHDRPRRIRQLCPCPRERAQNALPDARRPARLRCVERPPAPGSFLRRRVKAPPAAAVPLRRSRPDAARACAAGAPLLRRPRLFAPALRRRLRRLRRRTVVARAPMRARVPHRFLFLFPFVQLVQYVPGRNVPV